MKSSKIKRLTLRNIINSEGGIAIEADVELYDGIIGRGSAASAISSGRRENKTTVLNYNNSSYSNFVSRFQDGSYEQKTWDKALEELLDILGTDITLALSLAFARASAKSNCLRLVDYIKCCGNINQRNIALCPLIPIFSGGIHDRGQGGSMQQIMLGVTGMDFNNAVYVILSLYNELEAKLRESGHLKRYAASSGFLTDFGSSEEELDILSDAIENSGISQNLMIAVDVAAEHLKEGEFYRYYNTLLSSDELEEKLLKYAKDYPIKYIEDPFDFSDISNWTSLHRKLVGNVEIFSDDLSATQVRFLDTMNSDGVIVKMKQVGTLSSTLDLANTAHQMGLKTCVSHRSIETEDTFMCDLGVAIGTDYMKIGGPRRGDRVEKYNRLLHIYENADI